MHRWMLYGAEARFASSMTPDGAGSASSGRAVSRIASSSLPKARRSSANATSLRYKSVFARWYRPACVLSADVQSAGSAAVRNSRLFKKKNLPNHITP
jgi:hypothetical protein